MGRLCRPCPRRIAAPGDERRRERSSAGGKGAEGIAERSAGGKDGKAVPCPWFISGETAFRWAKRRFARPREAVSAPRPLPIAQRSVPKGEAAKAASRGAVASSVGWEKLAASVVEAERLARSDKVDLPALAARAWPVLHRLGPAFLDDPKQPVLLIESKAVFRRRRFHRQKAHYILSAMRHRAAELGDRARDLRSRQPHAQRLPGRPARAPGRRQGPQ